MQSTYEAKAEPRLLVRNLTVYQVNDLRQTQGFEPQGEYDFNSITPPRDYLELMKEPRLHLLDRISSYLQTLFLIAAKQHFYDNCTIVKKRFIEAKTLELTRQGQTYSDERIEKIVNAVGEETFWKCATVDEDKKNNITRIYLHEFALYPHRSQGPFTLDELKYFIEGLQKFAMNFYQNVQLILGTLPIRMNNQIENIALFVQCGENATVQPFSKQAHYEVFKGVQWLTRNILVSKIKLHECALYPQTNGQIALSYHDKNGLHIIPQSQFQFTPGLKRLPALLTRYQLNANSDDRERINAMVSYFYFDTHRLELVRDPFYSQDFDQSDECESEKTPTPVNIQDGNFIYTTAGNIQSRLTGDICYALSKEKGYQAVEKEILNAPEDLTLPVYAEHFIMSNVLDDSKKWKFVSNNIVVIDPILSRPDYQSKMYPADYQVLHLEGQLDLPAPAFGSHSKVNVYAQSEIGEHTPELNLKIRRHNANAERLSILRKAAVEAHKKRKFAEIEPLQRLQVTTLPSNPHVPKKPKNGDNNATDQPSAQDRAALKQFISELGSIHRDSLPFYMNKHQRLHKYFQYLSIDERLFIYKTILKSRNRNILNEYCFNNKDIFDSINALEFSEKIKYFESACKSQHPHSIQIMWDQISSGTTTLSLNEYLGLLQLAIASQYSPVIQSMWSHHQGIFPKMKGPILDNHAVFHKTSCEVLQRVIFTYLHARLSNALRSLLNEIDSAQILRHIAVNIIPTLANIDHQMKFKGMLIERMQSFEQHLMSLQSSSAFFNASFRSPNSIPSPQTSSTPSTPGFSPDL